jgi:hypothetical protein
MFSKFVLKFHALSTTAWALIGAIGATVLTGAAVKAAAFLAHHYRRPGYFRAAAIAEMDPFDNGHCFLLYTLLT